MLDRAERGTAGTIVKLGPGADYTQNWPPCESQEKTPDAPGIFGLLGMALAIIANALRQSWKRLRISPVPAHHAKTGSPPTMHQPTEKSQSALDKCRSVKQWRNTDECPRLYPPKRFCHPNAPTDTNPVLYPRLSQQPWLFPDFAGDSPKIPTEQSHRLRARRSPRKKRISTTAAQQITLFDP